jgi:hypothetical protein
LKKKKNSLKYIIFAIKNDLQILQNQKNIRIYKKILSLSNNLFLKKNFSDKQKKKYFYIIV